MGEQDVMSEISPRSTPSSTRAPRHVAIIMDGNGRWARARGLPREEGHRAGAQTVRAIVTRAREVGLDVLTLYAFSAQNWARPAHEISALMALLVEFCEGERTLLQDKGIRFRVIGERSRLPDEVRAAVAFLEEVTAELDQMQLVLALSYGGREELVQAAQRLAEDVAAGRLAAGEVDAAALEARLWTAGLPDPDLLIRTSGELRVSNFLLWQLAYTELYVEPRLWPDFDAAAFDAALASFGQRERRFGGLGAEAAVALAPGRSRPQPAARRAGALAPAQPLKLRTISAPAIQAPRAEPAEASTATRSTRVNGLR
jgi:undecaprenyl diphosphate synthase